ADLQRHFAAAADRLVDGGDELQRAASLAAVDERRRIVADAIAYVLEDTQVPEAVDGGGILAVLGQHFLVARLLVAGAPELHAVHGQAVDLDGAALAEYGDRPLEVRRPRRRGRLDQAQGAAREFHDGEPGVLRLDLDQARARLGDHRLDVAHHPLQQI